MSLFWKKLLIRSGLAGWVPSARRGTSGGEAYLRHFSDRVLAAPLADLHLMRATLDLPQPDGIDLGMGAPRFDIVPSSNTKLPADRRGYPPPAGLLELRELLAQKLSADHQRTFHPRDEILVTHGGAGAFSIAADAFVNPGDRVILFDPTSPLFSAVLRQRQARIHWLTTRIDGSYVRFNRTELAKAMRGARMIIFAQPNNPTGGFLATDDIEMIQRCSNRHKTLIYHDTAFDAYRFANDMNHVTTNPQKHDLNLIAGTVSKSHALTATRVGWLAGNRHLIGACTVTQTLQSPFVPIISQIIARAALQTPADVLNAIRDDFRSRRRYTYERLHAMGLFPRETIGAFFCWIPVDSLGLSGEECATQLLQSHGVVVWPGKLFGPSGKHHIRLSYALEEGRLAEGLRRLAGFVRHRHGGHGLSRPHQKLVARKRSSQAAQNKRAK